MTRLLDGAVAHARALPDDQQDRVAEALFAHIAGDDRRYRLTAEQIEEVKEIRESLRTGATRLLSDEEMDAVWRSCGL